METVNDAREADVWRRLNGSIIDLCRLLRALSGIFDGSENHAGSGSPASVRSPVGPWSATTWTERVALVLYLRAKGKRIIGSREGHTHEYVLICQNTDLIFSFIVNSHNMYRVDHFICFVIENYF